MLGKTLNETVVAWLEAIPTAIRACITTVCTDIWEGYSTAVAQVLPAATIVIDRCHVARHYRAGVDALRKQEVKRLKQEWPTEATEDRTRTRWPFRKRATDLDAAEQERLDGLCS